MITWVHWVCVRLVDLYGYLYLLVIDCHCIYLHVMVCWVETVLLCAEGQDTRGGSDRLKAREASQSGWRPEEQSRSAVGPTRGSIQAEGSYIHVTICMVMCGTLGELTKLWLIVSIYCYRYFWWLWESEGLTIHILLSDDIMILGYYDIR